MSEFECEIENQSNKTQLKTLTFTHVIKGKYIKIKSPILFIAEDGSVFVVTNKKGNKATYTSLKGIIEEMKNVITVENFSADEK